MPESPRNRPDVGNIFMQCLHLPVLRRYFVPLPWRFLMQPELQQGSDRLYCNQKHFLVLHAIKLTVYTSMNKLRAYFRVICAPIRSWSDISAQHFPSLPPGELGFLRPEISSRRPEISSRRPQISSRRPEISSQRTEILYQLINMYQLKILACPPGWRWPWCLS